MQQIEKNILNTIRTAVWEGRDITVQEALDHHMEEITAWFKSAKARYEAEKAANERQSGMVRHGLRISNKNEEILVLQRDLPVFCRERGLDREQIMRVSNGEIKEYRGYSRARTLPNLNGQEFRKPWEPNDEIKARAAEEKRDQTLFSKLLARKKESTPIPLKTSTYTPGEARD